MGKVDTSVMLCPVAFNLTHRDDKNKITLLSLQISGVCAEVFGLGEADIGQLCPLTDKLIEAMITDWLQKHL
jgi:hypothetical protein